MAYRPLSFSREVRVNICCWAPHTPAQLRSLINRLLERFDEIYSQEDTTILSTQWRIYLDKGSIHPFVEVYRPLEQPRSMG